MNTTTKRQAKREDPRKIQIVVGFDCRGVVFMYVSKEFYLNTISSHLACATCRVLQGVQVPGTRYTVPGTGTPRHEWIHMYVPGGVLLLFYIDVRCTYMCTV